MDKIPFYNLLNMLLVGIVTIIGTIPISPYIFGVNWRMIQAVINNDAITTSLFFALAYMIGLVVNRISSILIENILKTEKDVKERCLISRILCFRWRPYESYVTAEKMDKSLKIRTREYALSRNMLAAFLVLTVIATIYNNITLTITYMGISLLFYLSLRKHVSKIVRRIDQCINNLSPTQHQ